VLAFLAAGLLPMIVVALIGLQVSGALEDGANAAQEQTAGAVIDTVDRNLFERYGDVQAFAKSVPARSMDPAAITDWMDRMMGTYAPVYNLMVVADRQGRVIAVNGVDREGKRIPSARVLGVNVADQAWFRDTIARYEPGVTNVEDYGVDPLTSRVFGAGAPEAAALRFSHPIVDDAGRIVGVWSNRFNWDVVRQIFREELDGAAHEQINLLGRDGALLTAVGDGVGASATDAADKSGTAAFRAASGAARGSVADTEPETGDRVLAGYAVSKGYSAYPGLGWIVTANMDQDVALAAATSARNRILLAGLVLLVLVAGAAWLLARNFARAVITLRDDMHLIAADKDLMHRVEATRGDEIGDMARAFNAMMSHFHDIIRQFGETSRRLSEDSARSDRASDEAGRAAMEIAGTIEIVACSATDQAEQARGASDAMREIAGGAMEVANRGEQATAAAIDADEAASEGAETLSGAVTAMRELERVVSEAGSVVTGLGAKSGEIGRIVDTIGQIAEQTNLLALNAAIEAARAGEQGRGFAVVADEVRKLAEESARATANIAGLIEQVQHESGRAVEAMDTGIGAVRAGADRMATVDDAFTRIRERVAAVRDDIGQVAAAAQELQAGTHSAEASLQQMVGLAEANAAASEQVAASAEETGAAAEEVTKASAHVAGAARELSDLVGHFRVWNPGAPDRRAGRRDLRLPD
jgi:methyl-accepting chemotaxis protein